jgi:hypothetical protein
MPDEEPSGDGLGSMKLRDAVAVPCDTANMRDLIEGYFNLRQQAEGLKKTRGFEGLPWVEEDGRAVRRANDGRVLSVYRVEGDIEASVSSPDGTFKTYS